MKSLFIFKYATIRDCGRKIRSSKRSSLRWLRSHYQSLWGDKYYRESDC